MRTLTGYGIAVFVIFAVLNVAAWATGNSRTHDFAMFSAGFILGMLGMYLAANIYGYHKLIN